MPININNNIIPPIIPKIKAILDFYISESLKNPDY